MKSRTYKHRVFLLCLPWLAIVGSIRPAPAVVMYNVTFNDPGKQFVSFYDDITANAVAAGAAWGTHLVGDASIEVEISFDPVLPTATGASRTSAFVEVRNGVNILDVMNGVVFFRETRYDISLLDLAIFSDVGLPVVSATPEPSTISLWVGGGLWLLLLVARRRPRR